jgi:formyltetrahydrofolate deformylase
MSVLLLSCPDGPGIVASVAAAIADHGGNILDADQHTDRVNDRFLQRVEFDLDPEARDDFAAGFGALAADLNMTWELSHGARQRIVILVSSQGHCLYDLLGRHALGELDADIAAIISNHAVFADTAAQFGVPFIHLPVDPADPADQAARLSTELERLDPDLIVLARYMRILPPELCARFALRIINIHHSFLPAFSGARPYHQAFERGVKVIGATAHYATAELDQGPIISQDVTHVSHRDDVERLIARGRDLEKTVLARAVQQHLDHRVLSDGARTVVFD